MIVLCLLVLLIVMVIILVIDIFKQTYKVTGGSSYIERIVPKAIVKPSSRVVVSFSTIPSRVRFVPTVINRLRNQDLQPDAIYACIPYYSKRKKIPYEVPREWTFDSDVKIVRCEDYGPATKLLGCVKDETDPDTMIITIDDDHEYSPDTLKYTVTYAERYPNACISWHAMTSDLHPVACPEYYNVRDPIVNFLEGFGAPLYRRKYITEEMIDYFGALSPECLVSDDLTISTWLQMQNVPMIRLCDKKWEGKVDLEIDKHDALHDENRDHVYKVCKQEMNNLKNIRDFIWVKSFYFISNKYDLSEPLNTVNHKFNTKMFKDVKSRDVICIRTFHLGDFINKTLPYIRKPFTLITTDADECVPSDIWIKIPGGINAEKISYRVSDYRSVTVPNVNFKTFIDHPLLIKWFSANLEGGFINEKLKPIPLGIDYHTDMFKQGKSPYSQEQKLKSIMSSIPPLEQRPLTVLCTFQFNNSSTRFRKVLGEDRRDIYEKIKNNPVMVFPQKMPREKVYEEHGKHSFVLSPHGMGLDCHRTWEALLLGCIPIVRTSPLDHLYHDLPVVIVKDWGEIDRDSLLKWKVNFFGRPFNMDKLTMKYWRTIFS